LKHVDGNRIISNSSEMHSLMVGHIRFCSGRLRDEKKSGGRAGDGEDISW